MSNTFTACVVAGLTMAFAEIAVPAAAQVNTPTTDQIEQSQKASRVLDEVMATPDQAIPQAILDRAECVAVFPSVLKAGFIVGGRGGRGVVSCRTTTGWSGPAYLTLAGGSFGWQFGAESTDLVMLFMTDKGVDSLLSSKFTLGAGASVAAGPVGRQASADTDAKLNAEILSYSRSKGLFAGAVLNGTVIDVDSDEMHQLYGNTATARQVLMEGPMMAPAPVRSFPTTLAHYSSRKATRPTR